MLYRDFDLTWQPKSEPVAQDLSTPICDDDLGRNTALSDLKILNGLYLLSECRIGASASLPTVQPVHSDY